MRSPAIALATTLAACSSPPGMSGEHADAASAPDAASADDGAAADDAATTIDAPLPPPPRGFQIVTPSVAIDPGTEVTFCYYFRTPNTTELSIKKWASHMTPGAHHLILFLTPTKQKEPGTMSTEQCGFVSGGSGPVWTYSAQTPDAEAPLPPDDGQGKPVGQPIKAGQYGFIQMHYLNATDYAIQAHVELNGEAYDEGVQVTPAGPFVTYDDTINIGSGTAASPTYGQVHGDCDVRNNDGSTLTFFIMSTHTHKQGVHTTVQDGTAMVFESTSWDHPGASTWNSTPFFSFGTGNLSYKCEYMNPNNRVIVAGDSAATQEMCMAIGYYFPAPLGTGHLCYDGLRTY